MSYNEIFIFYFDIMLLNNFYVAIILPFIPAVLLAIPVLSIRGKQTLQKSNI